MAPNPGRRTTARGESATGPPDVASAADRDRARAADSVRTGAIVDTLAALADERLDPISAIDRLRRHTGAAAAWLWTITGDRAHLAIADGPAPETVSTVELSDLTVALDRLRRTGLVVCRSGELSGVEIFAPSGARSFIAAAAQRRDRRAGVLVLGWSQAEPLCSGTAAEQLRIAAALLTKMTLAASAPSMDESALHASILASLGDRIVAIDRDGTIIIAVNGPSSDASPWPGQSASGSIEPGANYLDLWRRAPSSSSLDTAAVLAGIEAVCAGTAPSFETSYAYRPIGDEEQWCVMRVTPLRRRGGGAVVVQSDVTAQTLHELARNLGNQTSRRLADAVPIPIWVVTPGEQMVFGNRAWSDATGSCADGVPSAGGWLDASHPDDRPIAVAAFRAAVARRTIFDIELRLRATDGAYRWWWFVGAPAYVRDGRIEQYVGVCTDATARRHAQQALRHVAGKLVAAQEAERSRIARELHDDIAQQVALLAARLDTAMHKGQLSRNVMHAVHSDLRTGLQDLATSIHHLSHQLHPAKVRLLGLPQTLEALCRDVSADSGVVVGLAATDVPTDLSEDTVLCVFRVAQEALQNAVRHSGARSIDVSITGTPTQLTLRVRDNGHGFDPLLSPTSASSSGLGLLTMRERVELMGGTLRIDTAMGEGTTIEADVPVNQGLALA